MIKPDLSLQELQKQLYDVIHKGHVNESLWNKIIAEGGAKISTARRLMIYHNDYKFRLIGLFESVFPKTAQQLGKVQFQDIVTLFYLNQPPTQPILGEACILFPEFLKGRFPQHFEIAQIELNELRAEVGIQETSGPNNANGFESMGIAQEIRVRLNRSAVLFCGEEKLHISVAEGYDSETISVNKKYLKFFEDLRVPRSVNEVTEMITIQEMDPEELTIFFQEMVQNKIIIVIPFSLNQAGPESESNTNSI